MCFMIVIFYSTHCSQGIVLWRHSHDYKLYTDQCSDISTCDYVVIFTVLTKYVFVLGIRWYTTSIFLSQCTRGTVVPSQNQCYSGSDVELIKSSGFLAAFAYRWILICQGFSSVAMMFNYSVDDSVQLLNHSNDWWSSTSCQCLFPTFKNFCFIIYVWQKRILNLNLNLNIHSSGIGIINGGFKSTTQLWNFNQLDWIAYG